MVKTLWIPNHSRFSLFTVIMTFTLLRRLSSRFQTLIASICLCSLESIKASCWSIRSFHAIQIVFLLRVLCAQNKVVPFLGPCNVSSAGLWLFFFFYSRHKTFKCVHLSHVTILSPGSFFWHQSMVTLAQRSCQGRTGLDLLQTKGQ